jgi:hydrogenase maturation protease
MSSGATAEELPATLVVGLGNPILGDDGVGWRVVEALEGRLAADAPTRRAVGPVVLDRVAIGGLSLMERLVGYERAVLVDAMLVPGGMGVVTVGPLEAIPKRDSGHLDNAHDASLVDALLAGRALGADLPTEITVVGVSVARVDEFGEVLSRDVEAAVEPAVDAILAVLGRRGAGVS